MSYIWQNFSEDTTYTIAERFSPYIEVLDDNPHYKDVNVLLRFIDVFEKLIQQRNSNRMFLDGIENPVLSFLADVDRLSGIDFRQILESLITIEIESNYFGAEVKKLFSQLNANDKKTIIDYIILKDASDDINSYLNEVIVALFSKGSCRALLYWQESLQRYVMYSPLVGSQRDLDKLNLVKLLFLDVGYSIEPVWEHHFGLIGVGSKMVIGNIKIV